MRGGKREGAGRKSSESTVRVSVPVGVLDEVTALIASYRQGELKTDQQIKTLFSLSSGQNKAPALKKSQQIKKPVIDSVQSVKEPILNDSQEIKDALKALQRLPGSARNSLAKSFGSLTKAVMLGVRADGRGFFVPDDLQHRIRVPAGRVLHL